MISTLSLSFSLSDLFPTFKEETITSEERETTQMMMTQQKILLKFAKCNLNFKFLNIFNFAILLVFSSVDIVCVLKRYRRTRITLKML